MAKLIKQYPDLHSDFISRLHSPLPYPIIEPLGTILQNMLEDEEALIASLQLVHNKTKIPYSLHGAFMQYVVRRISSEEFSSSFYLVPASANNFRKRLLHMVSNDPDRCDEAKRLLIEIDQTRDEYGRPEDEPRHPDLSSGISWPIPIPNGCK